MKRIVDSHRDEMNHSGPVPASDPHFLRYLARSGTGDLHPFGDSASQALLAVLGLQPGMRVLEVGCGTGRTLVRVLRSHAVELTGVDALPDMLAVAQLRLLHEGLAERARLMHVQGDGIFPLSAATFDAVYGESVLGYQDAQRAETLLREVARVLRPGGRCVFAEAVWREGVDDRTVERIHASSLRDFGLCQASPQNWPASAWCGMMERVGFRVISAVPLRTLIDGSRDAVISDRGVAWWRHAVRLLVSSHGVRDWLRYRRALRRHREDGRWVDVRLFMLERPADDGLVVAPASVL
jgi:SAM-dependent methyltransferase